MASPNPLRSITIRLNSTPVEDLPRYAGFLASSILNCSEAIRTAEVQKGDASVLLHKLKTRVSSLLQDKTSEGRFTGIVLVKAIVDAGGAQTLTSSGAWARNLLSCLNKQDPPEIKKLCLVTITRIFLLTKDYPALVREITTPALPSFITTSLSLIRPLAIVKGQPDRHVVSSLLRPVLECWLPLLHHFSSTFRPLLPQIRTIILSLISDETTPEHIRSLSANLCAAIHFSAPKNTASLDWSQTCQQIIEATHQTADIVFRSILEEWTSVSSRQPEPVNGKVMSNVESNSSYALGVGQWSGMQAGCLRIVYLLELLTAMLTSQQAKPVGISIAEIIDLTARLAAIVPPSAQFSLRQNQEIGRDEREELWIQLPRLHMATIELLNGLCYTYQRIMKPITTIVTSQIWDIFEVNISASEVRQTTYRAISTLLDECGLEITTAESGNLAALIGICCNDLRSGTVRSVNQSLPTMEETSTKSTNLALNSQKNSVPLTDQACSQQSGTYQAAWDLLPHLLTHAAPLLTASVRAELDRTAILLGHHDAMLASVLNPPTTRKGARIAPSILPFLARADNGNPSFEALVRPRMPVLMEVNGTKNTPSDQELQEDEVSSDQADIQMQQGNATESTQQIEEYETDQPATDLEVTKKRDFASIGPDPALVAPQTSETAKRPRIEDQLSTQTQKDGFDSSYLQGSGATSQIPSEKISIQQDHKLRDIVTTSGDSSAMLSPISFQKLVEQPAPSGIPSKLIQSGNDDDSDDDEIPTIDATLTSESEDEDEDEEMEES